MTFNNSVKPLLKLFSGKDSDEIYSILNAFYTSFNIGLKEIGCEESLTTAIVFRGVSSFFPIAASKLKDKNGSEYTIDNFYSTMEGMFSRVKPNRFKNPGTSYKSIAEYLENNIKSEFTL